MDNRRKLQAVKARLGEPKAEARHKGEYGFYCPNRKCNSAEQGKVRLWVNPAKDGFNCWHCGFSGRSLAPLMVFNSAEQREYLSNRPPPVRAIDEEKPRCSSLPEGFTPLGLRGAREEAPYLTYLRGRGIADHTMALYRMGYVDTGVLTGRVIVPSFDAVGMVNFWSARSVHPNEFLRYRLPQCSKDVVSNEYLIDWTKPVYIVEGIFDEIAIGPQAIALYGKFMQSQLALRLVEKRPPHVNVCLDADAFDEAFDLVRRLIGYDIPCSLVDLNEKDPALAGAAAVADAASAATRVTGSAGLVGIRL